MTFFNDCFPLRLSATAKTLLAAIVVLGVYASPVAGETPPLEFSEAVFKARKLTVSLESQLFLARREAADIPWIATTPLQPGVRFQQPESAPALMIQVSNSVLGTRSRTTTWIEPESGTALQRTVGRSSSKGSRYKGTRFAEEGVEELRSNRGEGEAADWTSATRAFRSYPEWMGDDVTVSDPTALFYLLTDPDLQAPGDALQFPVMSRGNLVLIEVTVDKSTRISADFLQTQNGEAVRVKGKRQALLVKVDARHLGPDSSEEDMELLGMKGDLEFYIDSELRVPLRLAGRVPKAGKVTLQLKAVTIP
jgi:hypothetical protein